MEDRATKWHPKRMIKKGESSAAEMNGWFIAITSSASSSATDDAGLTALMISESQLKTILIIFKGGGRWDGPSLSSPLSLFSLFPKLNAFCGKTQSLLRCNKSWEREREWERGRDDLLIQVRISFSLFLWASLSRSLNFTKKRTSFYFPKLMNLCLKIALFSGHPTYSLDICENFFHFYWLSSISLSLFLTLRLSFLAPQHRIQEDYYLLIYLFSSYLSILIALHRLSLSSFHSLSHFLSSSLHLHPSCSLRSLFALPITTQLHNHHPMSTNPLTEHCVSVSLSQERERGSPAHYGCVIESGKPI